MLCCGAKHVLVVVEDLDILPPSHRVTPRELAGRLRAPQDSSAVHCDQRHLLVDVRSEQEFRMCCIDGAVNYPVEQLYGGQLEELLAVVRTCSGQVTFVCRRGNDSQTVAQKVLGLIEDQHRSKIKDLAGGLHAWAKHVDNTFPIY